MKEIKYLLRRTFDLWVRKRWLKEVNKVCDKYAKTKEKVDKRYKKDQEKLNKYSYIANTMMQEYKDKYFWEDLR